tara:strand:+ start:1209 stop:1457 length:249 start_codon:yes stop_codon:yes gene_type:complete
MATPAATPNGTEEKLKRQELLEEANEQLRKTIKNLKADLEEMKKNCALGLEIAKEWKKFEREEAAKKRRIMQDAEKFSKPSA